jgi:hypothetical protein
VEIIDGFHRYCQDYAFNYKVINNIENDKINAGEAFITVMEDDLVNLIERLMQLDLKAGEDVGIISYNETPIKKIILNGITTISTNFEEMGKMAARLILEDQRQHLEVPFKLTLRNSLKSVHFLYTYDATEPLETRRFEFIFTLAFGSEGTAYIYVLVSLTVIKQNETNYCYNFITWDITNICRRF